MTVFEAYITNLGKYAEGQLVGETLKFPAITEEVQSLLKNIGVDGVLYEEFFITAFDGDVMGLYDYLTEYENLDELNHLAHLISELDSDEIETLEAALNKGDHTSSVEDIINLVHNLDCYDLHPGVTDDETLGRIYVEDMELLDVPDNVLPYFDFEAYGRDMRINEGGHFAPTGYLTRSGDFKEVYHGIEDIPAEHRIFAYPGNVLFVPTVTGGIHPTQKPVELCEYFIKTYTNEGAVVADICAGSGTTAVAAMNTGRRFICFENAPSIYTVAAQRIEQARLAVTGGEKGE